MKLNQKPGIYILIIKSPNKIYKYVGQSINISKRVYVHRNALKNNKHYNTYMQNVYNKYCNSIKDVVIKYINYEKDYLNTMEQTWINIIQTEKCVCLNTKPGKACSGYTLNEEHKKAISLGLKNSKLAQDQCKKMTKVRVLNYKGKSQKQLESSKKNVRNMHTAEAKLKSLNSRLNSQKFKEARKVAGQKMLGNKHALGKTNGIKNGNCDPALYVFQNKNTQEIFVCTRYKLADIINKTSYSLSNMITGKEKSAFGFKLLACPLSK